MTTEFDKATPTIEQIEALRKEMEWLRSERAEAQTIIGRIWTQLGGHSYEELAGRSIYDLIEELKAKAAVNAFGSGQGDAVAWRDISSAPKDGWFMGYWPEKSEPAERFAATIWDEQATDGPRFLDIADSMNGVVTHWMPLPLHPPISGPGAAHPPATSARIADLPDRKVFGQMIYDVLYADRGGNWQANMTQEVWFEIADRLRATLAGGRT